MSATCNATRPGPAGYGVLSLGVLVLTMEWFSALLLKLYLGSLFVKAFLTDFIYQKSKRLLEYLGEFSLLSPRDLHLEWITNGDFSYPWWRDSKLIQSKPPGFSTTVTIGFSTVSVGKGNCNFCGTKAGKLTHLTRGKLGSATRLTCGNGISSQIPDTFGSATTGLQRTAVIKTELDPHSLIPTHRINLTITSRVYL